MLANEYGFKTHAFIEMFYFVFIADEIVFISGPMVVAPFANIELRADYQSNQGVKNSKWMKIKKFTTNQLSFENPKYSIENLASYIKTQKILIAKAETKEDSAAYQLSLDNIKSNKINIFVDGNLVQN